MKIKKNPLAYLSINGCYKFLDLYTKNNVSMLYFYDIYNVNSRYFGIFITIERNIHKLSMYPEEIHGCLGYYNKSLKVSLNKSILINKSLELGNNTAYTDERRQYFPELYLDYLSVFKVSIMKLPLYNINPSNGFIILKKKTNNTKEKKYINKYTKKTKIFNNIIFNNKKFGLLTINKYNQTATYLPGVFKNVSWYDIKSRLENKAGIKQTENTILNTNFYAYTTDIQKESILNFFISKEILSLKYLEHIIKIMNMFNKTGIPAYELKKNDIILYDEEQYVRNCGVCSSIIKGIYFIIINLDKKYISRYMILFKNALLKCMNYLMDIWILWKSNNILYTQASSFIIIGFIYYLKLVNIKTILLINDEKYNIRNLKSYIIEYCNYILNKKEDLEPKFEYGECGVALYTAYILLKSKIKLNVYDYLIVKNLKINNNMLDIFQVNWIIQMLCILYKITTIDSQNMNYNIYLYDLIKTLFSILDKYYLSEIKKQSSDPNNWNINIETNYIAVAYEACMTIKLKLIQLSSEYETKLNQYILLLSLCLISRKGNNNSLYKFILGNSRLDITSHTIVC